LFTILTSRSDKYRSNENYESFHGVCSIPVNASGVKFKLVAHKTSSYKGDKPFILSVGKIVALASISILALVNVFDLSVVKLNDDADKRPDYFDATSIRMPKKEESTRCMTCL
jgi:hypothetical protein